MEVCILQVTLVYMILLESFFEPGRGEPFELYISNVSFQFRQFRIGQPSKLQLRLIIAPNAHLS